MSEFFEDRGDQGFFESFSDVALCTLTVTLVLLSLLATNVRQSINVTLNENQFNQDALLNRTYLTCSVSETGEESVVHFLDADRMDDLISVKEERVVGRRIRLDGARSMSRRHFSLVAPGLVPGCNAAGSSTLVSLPERWLPQVEISGIRYELNTWLSGELLEQCSLQKPFEGMARRTRVYVESMRDVDGSYHALIGHAVYSLPSSIEDGSLDWLKSFMSGTVDLIYLGDLSSRVDENRRLRFMEERGYTACAYDYRSFLNRTDLNAEAEVVPFSAYPVAWQAYVDWRMEIDEDPPTWFFSEFLVKLGFDRMVMDAPVEE